MQASISVSPKVPELVQPLVDETFSHLFGNQDYQFDLIEGTITDRNNTRIIYISSDIVRGIYEALYFEAGEAWKIILKSCGYIWGKRVSDYLDNELKTTSGQGLHMLTVKSYIDLLEKYVATHGWGRACVYLNDAEQHGIVRVSMMHSLFVNSLNDLDERVDHIIAGMLKGMFENISGHSLECIEVICTNNSTSPTCEFLISAPERIASIEALAEEGVTLDAIVEQLRQT